MKDQLTALADPSRWRIIEILAEQPRSVSAVAELSGLRQPQATKHLQTLERAGLAVSRRSGHRRIYAVEAEMVEAVVRHIGRVADVARTNQDQRDQFDRYAAAVEAETRASKNDQWADGRQYVLKRALAADRRTVWQHITEPSLLSTWWTTRDLRLSHIRFPLTPGGQILQEYVDADTGSAEIVGRAVGVMEGVGDGDRISFHLSPVLPDGTVTFTAHYEWTLSEAAGGTEFEVRLRVSGSTAAAAEFIAGIQLGWEQSLDNLVANLAGPTAARMTTRTTKETS